MTTNTSTSQTARNAVIAAATSARELIEFVLNKVSQDFVYDFWREYPEWLTKPLLAVYDKGHDAGREYAAEHDAGSWYSDGYYEGRQSGIRDALFSAQQAVENLIRRYFGDVLTAEQLQDLLFAIYDTFNDIEVE